MPVRPRRSPRPGRALAAVALGAGLTLAACGGDDDAPSGAPATTAASAPGTAPTAALPEQLQFTAPLVGGGEFDGTSVAGKPTAFWFWAPT